MGRWLGTTSNIKSDMLWNNIAQRVTLMDLNTGTSISMRASVEAGLLKLLKYLSRLKLVLEID